MPKYRDYFRRMLAVESELFEEFGAVHAKYEKNQERNQDEFNRVGKRVVEVIREWENKLCDRTERGVHSKFSSRLAEKFQEEVKTFFPLIDFVGVEVTRPAVDFVVNGKKNEEKVSEEEMDTDILEIEKIAVLDDDGFTLKKLL